MRQVKGASDVIDKPPCGLEHVISDDIDSPIAYIISDFGYHLCPGIWMMCYQERHTLLLKCFINPWDA